MALKTTLGVDLSSAITLADRLEFVPVSVSVEEGIRQTGEAHQASGPPSSSARWPEVWAAYGNHFPQVSLSYMYDGQWSKNWNEVCPTANGYSVGVVVTLPLFDGFLRENALNTAKAKFDRVAQAEGLAAPADHDGGQPGCAHAPGGRKKREASRKGLTQAEEEFRIVKERRGVRGSPTRR